MPSIYNEYTCPGAGVFGAFIWGFMDGGLITTYRRGLLFDCLY